LFISVTVADIQSGDDTYAIAIIAYQRRRLETRRVWLLWNGAQEVELVVVMELLSRQCPRYQAALIFDIIKACQRTVGMVWRF
jgi:hypothetical protein